MGENSKISWTDNTFNPWSGCTKVSPGCAHCYAETLSHRAPSTFGEWGKGAPRKRTSERNWNDPIRWNRNAERNADASGDGAYDSPLSQPARRPRVFCASLSDWLDDEVPVEWLRDLLALIHKTPYLDWLLLSKRPENWAPRIEAVLKLLEATPGFAALPNSSETVRLRDFLGDWFVLRRPPHNVWIGTTVENQDMVAKRIPVLLSIPATVRFLSCEPLLGPVNLASVMLGDPAIEFDPLRGTALADPAEVYRQKIHWVIVGGESGPGARPMSAEWARSLRDQCSSAGVSYFFKQWGGVRKEDHGRELDGRTHDEFPIP